MKICLYRLIPLVFLISFNPIISLAELKIELQPSASTLLLGDEITLQLKIDGTQSKVELKSPDVSGLNFRVMGHPARSSQTFIVNGKVTSFSGLVYTIGVSAEKTGSYQIPGFEVVYDGKSYKSVGFNLSVKQPGQQSKMKLTVHTDKNIYYWQEPVVVTLKWYIQEDVEDYGFRFPLLEQKKQLALTMKEQTGSGSPINLKLEGYKVPFTKISETLDGEIYTVYQSNFVIIPPDPGPYKIPTASVKAMIREGTELKRDFFGRVVRAPKLKRIFAASKPLRISVESLPSNGRPPYFTGAVGRFQINTSIENTRVKVGDPVELSIKITGEGRYEVIEPPLLTENREFAENFSISTNLQPGDIQPDGVLFKQTIRPRHDNITRIPTIKFSYFNPLLETYQTIESKPIPIKVLATGRVKKEDVVVHSSAVSREVQSFTREDKGIFANYMFEDALESQTLNWSWFLLLFCPPVLYIGVLVYSNRKLKLQNDLSLVRAKAAKSVGSKRLKQAKKQLGTEGDAFYLELSRALRGYVADKLNLGAGEVTTIDIKRLGEQGELPPDIVSGVADFLDELDRRRFTSQATAVEDHNSLFESASQLIQDLNKKIK
ncbi:MAG: BatD family protein [Proteobacteria bacterium]|nr:BatD family protein [Pseudomonadota bacterium]